MRPSHLIVCSASLWLAPVLAAQSEAASATPVAKQSAAQERAFSVGGIRVRRLESDGQAKAMISRDGGKQWMPLQNPDDRLHFRLAQFDPLRGAVELPGVLAAPAGTRLFVVQFQTQILAEYQQAVRDRGVQILHYMPENALFVRADAERAMDRAWAEAVVEAAVRDTAQELERAGRGRAWVTFRRHFVEGASYDAIASETGLPVRELKAQAKLVQRWLRAGIVRVLQEDGVAPEAIEAETDRLVSMLLG